MEKFIKLKSIPAHIPLMNIDTDMIIPKQFLKTIKRTGLGKNLFFEMRYDDKGKELGKNIPKLENYTDKDYGVIFELLLVVIEKILNLKLEHLKDLLIQN